MPTQKLVKTCCLKSSDNELVQQALAGDMSGFETLVDRYNRMLTNWAYRILRNHQQVEDQRPISTAQNLFYEQHYNFIKIS